MKHLKLQLTPEQGRMLFIASDTMTDTARDHREYKPLNWTPADARNLLNALDKLARALQSARKG